jgi:hypothetical protein
LSLLTSSDNNKTELQRHSDHLQQLQSKNGDFAGQLHDRRETMNMWWRIGLCILSIFIDFMLCYESMQILCSKFGWPSELKYVVPIFLILTEIGIAHFQAIHKRNGVHAGWLASNVQYLVLAILVALAILTIVYSISAYNPAIDNMSFLSYCVGVILFQGILLIASIMLHVWLIKNAEEIADAIAFLSYKMQQGSTARKCNELNKSIATADKSEFVSKSQQLVQKVKEYERMFTENPVDFSTTMPTRLIEAVNSVMGKEVFTSN